MQSNAANRVVEHQRTAAAAGKALAVVALAAALSSETVEQAAHGIRTGGGAVVEADEDMVAYLGDEYESAVALHVTAPAGIRGHHPDPVRVHVVSLPVHAHLDAAAAPGVVVPGHRCHLRLGMGDACVGHGNHLKGGGECLETVAVVAVLTHLVHDLGDDELSQRLAGEGPEGLVEGAVYLDDAAHTQTRHTALGGDVVALRRLGRLLAAHVVHQLGTGVDTLLGILACRDAEQLHRGCHRLAGKEVLAGRLRRARLVHLLVGRGVVAVGLLGTGKRLDADVKR